MKKSRFELSIVLPGHNRAYWHFTAHFLNYCPTPALPQPAPSSDQEVSVDDTVAMEVTA